MVGPIEAFLTTAHQEIDALLGNAERADGSIDAAVFAEFRQALLRHIAMEEKTLLPYAKNKRGGEPLPIAATLRKDHGEMASLLVPSPTSSICAQLRSVLAGEDAEQVVARLEAQPAVPMAPHYDGPLLSKKRR